MHCTSLVSCLPAPPHATDVTLHSLYAAFATIPDPRSRHGQRYPLAFLLTCLVAALLCNCNSTCAVSQWCREQRTLLRRVFGSQRHLTPSDSLYRWLLPRVEAAQIEAALSGWVQATRPANDTEAVAVDGKTVCGARTDTQAAPHLLAFCTHETQETLLQVRVSDKTNEIPVAQAAAPRLPWQGRVLTADALHTQTALVATLRALGGELLLTVKDNQPTLAADLALFFADLPTPARHAQTVDRQRGRQEIRDVWVSSDLSAYLATHSRWPGVAQVGCLRRRVRVAATGVTRDETVYFITTLTAIHASPERLLQLTPPPVGAWALAHRESAPLCA